LETGNSQTKTGFIEQRWLNTWRKIMGTRATIALRSRSTRLKAVEKFAQSYDQQQTVAQPLDEIDQRVSVLVTDATPMTAELLTRALSRVKTLNVVKSAVNLREALEAIVNLRPNVAIISTHLADGPYLGFEILRQVRQLAPATQCVVLMDDSEHNLVVDAFRAGARGIFKRSGPMRLLGRCIFAVHSGQVWASNSDLQQVLQELEKTIPFRCVNARGEVLLTRREEEIIPLIAQGLTNKEISARLSLSEHTIKNHLFRIYEKLGICSRVELILYAVSTRNGIP
jgi:DNA-binding NarL/FixJ family response regulator